MFQKATRRRAKLKIAITGPSGSGKTYSALLLAKGIGGKIALIDTENDSASLYADQPGMPEFDTMNLRPPYTTAKYLEAMNAAVAAGYEILIVDSASHQWAGEGGVLARKEALDQKPGSNSYTNWGKLTPEQEKFKASILQSPIHLIVTLRSKQEYALSRDEKSGKNKVEKLGMAPIQRDGMEYEFTTVFDADMTHNVTTSKDRTGLFDGKYFMLAEATGKELAAWLFNAAEAKVPAPAAGAPQQAGAEGVPPGSANPPRITSSEDAPSVYGKNDPERKITEEEFNDLKRLAHQHLWNKDQFFIFMRERFKTAFGPTLTLAQMVEFKQAIVSMSGADATAGSGSGTSQSANATRVAIAPKSQASQSLPPEKDDDEKNAAPKNVVEMNDPHPSDADLGLALPPRGQSGFESFNEGLRL